MPGGGCRFCIRGPRAPNLLAAAARGRVKIRLRAPNRGRKLVIVFTCSLAGLELMRLHA